MRSVDKCETANINCGFGWAAEALLLRRARFAQFCVKGQVKKLQKFNNYFSYTTSRSGFARPRRGNRLGRFLLTNNNYHNHHRYIKDALFGMRDQENDK